MKRVISTLVLATSLFFSFPLGGQARALAADSFATPFLDSTTSVYVAGLHQAVIEEIDVQAIMGGEPTLRWDWSLVRPTSGYSGLFTSDGGRSGVRGKIREGFALDDTDPNTDVDIFFGIVDVASYGAAVSAIKKEAKYLGMSRPTITSNTSSTWLTGSVRNDEYKSVDSFAGLVVKRGKRSMIVYALCYRYEASRAGNNCTVKQLESAVSTISFSLPPLRAPVANQNLDLPTSIPRSLKPISATPSSTYDLVDSLDKGNVFGKSFGDGLPPLTDPYGWTATSMTFHIVGQKKLTMKVVTFPIGSSPSPTSFPGAVCMNSQTNEATPGCTRTALAAPPAALSSQIGHTVQIDDSFEVFESQVVTPTKFISVGCGREDYLPLTKREQSACRSASKDIVAIVASR